MYITRHSGKYVNAKLEEKASKIQYFYIRSKGTFKSEEDTTDKSTQLQ